MATGSELSLAVEAKELLLKDGMDVAGGPEVTLEDFLARESAVKEDEVKISVPPAPVMGLPGGAEGVSVPGGGGGRERKRQLVSTVDRARSAIQREKIGRAHV